MVCCSLPEASTLLNGGQVRAIGVMAPQRAEDYPDVKTFVEQGRDWSLGGWRGLVVPLGTPDSISNRLATAIERIVTEKTTVAGKTFPEFMRIEGFNNTWRRPDEFERFCAETDEKLGKLLISESMRSVNTDRYSPMAFPYILFALMGITLVALVVPAWLRSSPVVNPVGVTAEVPPANVGNFIFLVAAMIVFLLFAEMVGFVILGGAMLFSMLKRFGCGWRTSTLISLCITCVLYHAFVHFLRVPLPRGWFGW